MCCYDRPKENRRPSYTSLQQLQQSKQPLTEDAVNKLAVDTLEELDWCLDQLETIQSHRSVGDMATSKFRRMLNKELSHFSETKSGSQISEYIFRTFLGNCLLLFSMIQTLNERWVRFLDNYIYPNPDKQEELDLPFLKLEDGTAQQSGAAPGHVVATAKSILPGPNRPELTVQKAAQTMSQIIGVKKPLSHTNSLTKLPKHGVETPHEDELDKIYTEIDKWGLDMFKVAEFSNKHPLTSIMYTIFRVSAPPVTCLSLRPTNGSIDAR